MESTELRYRMERLEQKVDIILSILEKNFIQKRTEEIENEEKESTGDEDRDKKRRFKAKPKP